MNGIQSFLEILAAAGIRYIFGNPGTTELPLNDALVDDLRFQYRLGLHEIPIVAMADGYAMASGKVGVVNVHTCCGLGNAMGMLYNAHCEGSPLLIVAGQQDRRLRLEEPVLEGDMVSVARPWTKWSIEVTRTRDLPTVTRRAIQVALTPPRGPVFISIPVDVQMEIEAGFDLSPPVSIYHDVRPDPQGISQAAGLMAAARRPMILAGSRVAEDAACGGIESLAEAWGAAVFSESATSHGRLPLRSDHPHYCGPLPLWSPDVQRELGEFDAMLVVGADLFRQYIVHEPANPIPAGMRVIQVDNNSWQLGKNYSVDVAIQCHLQAGLERLSAAMAELTTTSQRELIVTRCRALVENARQRRTAVESDVRSQLGQRPLTPLVCMSTIANVLSPGTIVVEEAVTTTNMTLERLGAIRDPIAYFGHRGWALGWGLGCAIGAKLAWPERPAIALLGDGAALYGIQGLWTAAHYQIPVTFVVCNNRQYKILKQCAAVMPLPQMAQEKYLGMDLVQPAIDYVGLSQSFGVSATRVDSPEDLAHHLEASFESPSPSLIEVVLAD